MAPTPPSLPARLAKRDRDGVPVLCDRECDLTIPGKLFSAWIPDRGHREVRRELTAEERTKVQGRAEALQSALVPYTAEEKRRVSAQIAAMLNGFRAMRHQRGEHVEATVEILCAVLREFPSWAIAKACMKIARNDAGLGHDYAPNDSEVHSVVQAVLLPYEKAMRTAEALLVAPVERPLPAPAKVGAPPKDSSIAAWFAARADIAPLDASHDGKHAQRVMAEIAARKAARENTDEDHRRSACGND